MSQHGAKPKIRCAVYTRKSSEEGLQQEFNSLHSQRAAGEAYIASQSAEGWLLVPNQYDDGGISGATLERPALRRLLADVEAGKVDCVVVYKVDRLSRSLTDFAKLVDVFERHGVSFVSVTQHFCTATSMGRLTLNILLSFAQFEREVIGERIRDKFTASRAKGMWMGGSPPLGYDVKDRRLVVNPAEAELVRLIEVDPEFGTRGLSGAADWVSRAVLAWRLSNTLDAAFCVEALEEALLRHGRPDIFNTDQGAQFTSAAFTGRLEAAAIAISMDGRGRWLDNVFVERLWRSLKYEEVHLKAYADGREARTGIGAWIAFYNERRPHQALGYRTPMAVWRDGITAVDMTLRLDDAVASSTCPQPQQQPQAA